MKPVFPLLFCLTLSLPVYSAPTAKPTARTAPAGNSLAGLKISMDKDAAHAALIAQGAVSSQKDTDSQEEDKKNAGSKTAKGADPDDAVPEVWTLKGTPYERIAFAVDESDKVTWVTGFARAGQGVPFAALGSLTRAAASGPTFAVWNVISPAGSYRVVARGRNGRASVVSLLPLKSANPSGAFSPQIIPKSLRPTPAKGSSK